MVDREAPPAPNPVEVLNARRGSRSPEHRFAVASEPVSILPNVGAALVSFVFLMVAPPVCSLVLGALIDAEFVSNDLMSQIIFPIGLIESATIALGGSLLFLVLGMTLQLWERHRPFASGWPIALAFPVAWALVLPEALVGGGSVVSRILIGGGIAVAFSVHWLALSFAREAID